MLILPDSSSLGDTHLSPEEGVAKLKEGNLKLAAEKKIPNQSLLENHEMARGQMKDTIEFIADLMRLSPYIRVEPGGIPNAVAVRVITLDTDPESPTHGTIIKKYITGFYVDRPIPEFSSLYTDKNGLPTRESRGWRSVLLALFHAKVVTYEEIKNAFGEPHGQRGSMWMEQTQAHR